MNAGLAVVQLAASVSLTLASMIVSVVAVVFTYRNNFGWPPIVLITSIGLSNIPAEHGKYKAHVSLEIWNRRKYPIVIRNLSVGFRQIELIEDADDRHSRSAWRLHRNAMVKYDEHTLAPQSQEKQEVTGLFEASSLDTVNAPLDISIVFFDPRANRTINLRAAGLYSLNAPANERPWQEASNWRIDIRGLRLGRERVAKNKT
jgi:hypothetical protein